MLIKNNRGQAMIETLLTTTFMTVMVFAAVQLVIMVVTDLTMNEAAFSISRVAVVSKKIDMSKKIRNAELYLILRDINLSNMTYIGCDDPVDGIDIQGRHSGSGVKIYSTTVEYIQNVIFGSLLSGSKMLSIGNVNLIKNTSRARMIKSPDEEYYEKAYKDGPCF